MSRTPAEPVRIVKKHYTHLAEPRWQLRRVSDNKYEAGGFRSEAEARDYCIEYGHEVVESKEGSEQ